MKLNMYRGKKANVLSALTFNDASLWSADVFVAAIFALYITHNIENGSAIDVGLAFAVYQIMRSITAIPLGKYFDAHRGHIDEFYALIFSGVLVGGTYMGLFFATEMWQVYLGMALIGAGHAIDIGSWKILFYGNIPAKTRGEVVGIYETFMRIIYSFATVIAGFVGEIFGFEWIFFFAAILAFASSLIMFLMSQQMRDF